jgi:hypothetical protein
VLNAIYEEDFLGFSYFDKVTLELKPFRALRGVQPTAVFSLSQLLARSEYTALQKLCIMRIRSVS